MNKKARLFDMLIYILLMAAITAASAFFPLFALFLPLSAVYLSKKVNVYAGIASIAAGGLVALALLGETGLLFYAIFLLPVYIISLYTLKKKMTTLESFIFLAIGHFISAMLFIGYFRIIGTDIITALTQGLRSYFLSFDGLPQYMLTVLNYADIALGTTEATYYMALPLEKAAEVLLSTLEPSILSAVPTLVCYYVLLGSLLMSILPNVMLFRNGISVQPRRPFHEMMLPKKIGWALPVAILFMLLGQHILPDHYMMVSAILVNSVFLIYTMNGVSALLALMSLKIRRTGLRWFLAALAYLLLPQALLIFGVFEQLFKLKLFVKAYKSAAAQKSAESYAQFLQQMKDKMDKDNERK